MVADRDGTVHKFYKDAATAASQGLSASNAWAGGLCSNPPGGGATSSISCPAALPAVCANAACEAACVRVANSLAAAVTVWRAAGRSGRALQGTTGPSALAACLRALLGPPSRELSLSRSALQNGAAAPAAAWCRPWWRRTAPPWAR